MSRKIGLAGLATAAIVLWGAFAFAEADMPMDQRFQLLQTADAEAAAAGKAYRDACPKQNVPLDTCGLGEFGKQTLFKGKNVICAEAREAYVEALEEWNRTHPNSPLPAFVTYAPPHNPKREGMEGVSPQLNCGDNYL